MSEKAQKNVVEFIEKGGKLLILTTVPYMDYELKDCTILKDYINEDIKPFKFYTSLTLVKDRRVYGITKYSIANCSSDATAIAFDEDN